MKIYCFDFDKTLFNTLDKEDGHKLYEEKFGTKCEIKGWYTHPLSLDKNFHKPLLIDDIYKWYLKALEEEAKIYIITGRDNRPHIHQLIVEILEDYNFEYDKLLCKPPKSDTLWFKQKAFNEIYMENRTRCTDFIILDDREEHREKMIKWCDEAQNYNPNTNFYFIDSNINEVIYGNTN